MIPSTRFEVKWIEPLPSQKMFWGRNLATFCYVASFIAFTLEHIIK